MGKGGEEHFVSALYCGAAALPYRPPASLLDAPPPLPTFPRARSDLALKRPVIQQQNFAYVGTFERRDQVKKLYSVKLIAKYKAASAGMDGRLLDERNVLAALGGRAAYVPHVLGRFQVGQSRARLPLLPFISTAVGL